jgi:hypothetical protein
MTKRKQTPALSRDELRAYAQQLVDTGNASCAWLFDVTAFAGPPQHAATSIGRAGSKAHPVKRYPGQVNWTVRCSCGGTANGHWKHYARILPATQANCGNQ